MAFWRSHPSFRHSEVGRPAAKFFPPPASESVPKADVSGPSKAASKHVDDTLGNRWATAGIQSFLCLWGKKNQTPRLPAPKWWDDII